MVIYHKRFWKQGLLLFFFNLVTLYINVSYNNNKEISDTRGGVPTLALLSKCEVRREDNRGLIATQWERLDNARVCFAALAELFECQSIVVILVHLVEDFVNALLRCILVFRLRGLTLKYNNINCNVQALFNI